MQTTAKARVKTKLYQIRIDAYTDAGTGRTSEQQTAWAEATSRKLLAMPFPHLFCAAYDSANGYVIVELAAFPPTCVWSEDLESQYQRACAEVADAADAIRSRLEEEFGRKAAYLSVREWYGEAPEGLRWLNSSGYPSATGKKPVAKTAPWFS
jgi:hypothetical protein